MTPGHFDIGKAGRLDREERIKELRPEQLITEVGGVTAGMTCVDLGCGTGTFSLPMARVVGPEGIVYAVDDSAQMLGYLRAKDPPPNLRPVERDAEQTGLDGQIAGFCLLAFILHEVKKPDSIVGEAFRLLRPEGRVLVVEWKADLDSPGPPRSIRVSRTRAEQLLEKAGFSRFAHVDWSRNHYAVTAEKPARTAQSL